MNAWTTVGSVWPELRVPGMMRSGTSFNHRKSAVVVANDPIPRVSKKFVTAPTPMCVAVGKRASAAGEVAAGFSRRMARTARVQPPTNTAVSTPSAVRSPVRGFSVLGLPGPAARPNLRLGAGGNSLQQLEVRLQTGAGFPHSDAVERLTHLLEKIVGQARLGDESAA